MSLMSTKANLTTAIIIDEADAELFISLRPEADIVRPLTPNALAILTLLDGQLPIYSAGLSDCQQARIIARVRRVKKSISNALLDQNDIPKAIKSTFLSIVHLIATSGSLAWEISNFHGPCIVSEKGEWKELDSRYALQVYLVSRFSSNIERLFKRTELRPWFSSLLHWINTKQTNKKWARERLVFNDFSYGSLNVLKLIMAETDKFQPVVMMQTKSGFLGLVKSLFILSKNTFKPKEAFGLLAIPSKINSNYEKPNQIGEVIIQSINDPILKPIFQNYRSHFIRAYRFLHSMTDNIREYITDLKPAAVISNQVRWYHSAILAEVSEQLGIDNHLFSHGSHTVTESRLANFERTENANGLLYSSLLSTINYFQSPQSALFASLENVSGYNCTPLMWGYKSINQSKQARNERIILHAGTYKTFGSPRPWIYETSIELIEATKDIENTKLVIRIRVAPECSLAALKSLLPKYPHYQLKTEGTFLEDLAEAQLLVSYSSTTIEEALVAKKPVLLWGGTQRYYHLPPRKQIPVIDDRAAVYAPMKKEDLSRMIRAILDVHAEKPLTQDELDNLVWPSSTRGIEVLLSNLGV